ncbi:aminotransferase [Mesorhizobium sp.]|uniref:aminotransferase n=1 Tax=Mesorhizobium sp. TaxID=1871066 RepID=UPI000FE4F74C|nr:aminotransferase [Mesorhizobium sp.]RWC63296.1 MAG: aminotransferase class III-fold pyridoxal phosphate-dependent enzyme [Mesorhizobium sp.]RWC66949.1 MAG: aminotransferase class III-fold pyridoxal phosphate-dependent enzyme [Mesorhizobium sp.]
MSNNHRAAEMQLHLHSQTNPRLHETEGPLMVVEGRGATVVDDSGRRYIEGMSGLWCASLGFSNERLANAAYNQMRTLGAYHTANHRSNEPVAELLRLIEEISPIPSCKIYLTSTGSEATDSMVKLAWYYNFARGKPGKRKIISRQSAYHGSTVMAAALCGLPNMHRAFNLPTGDILYARRPHHFREAEPNESMASFGARLARELEAMILAEGADNIAAMIAEPVMGAGGVFIPPESYFPLIQEVLARHDILLLADEIICGFGRTGNWFGSETFKIKPDMVSIAKGLSAGHMPIAGVIMSDRIYQAVADQAASIGVFGHGFTYSGHPVTSAVAVEAIRIYQEIDIVGLARSAGSHLLASLRRKFSDHEFVGDIRGVGLLGGIEIVADRKDNIPFAPEERIGAKIEMACRRRGALVRNMGDTIAFCPPFQISEAETEQLVEIVHHALEDVLGR